MRLALVSPAVAAALAAAIVWSPLPRSFVGGEDDTAAARLPPSPAAIVEPAAITPSHAATFVRFGPETADAAGAAAPPPKPAPPALVGLIGSGPRRIAYVTIGGQTVRAGLWDKVGPYRLTAIGPRGVTLSAGRKSLSLAFFGPRPQPPAPAPVTAATDVDAQGGPPPPTTPAPRVHALEPASAPPRGGGRGHARYWAGPPGSAPPGYILLKPGQTPPQ